MIPVAVWHTASLGIDAWLSAIALGASQVAVLTTSEEAPQYREGLREQMALQRAMSTGSYLYGFKDSKLGFGHWNDLGHRVAAELIAARLCASGF